LFTWAQNTEVKAVAWWGSAHLLRAASITLFGMYGHLPDVVTIDLSNAILLTSFAVTWTGARVFGGHKPNLMFVFEGAIIWLIACRMQGFAESGPLRAIFGAAIIAAYTWMAGAEVYASSSSQYVSRLPASFMLFAHGALFLLRTPLAVLMPHPAGTEAIFGSVWFTALSSEALLFTIAIAFILMAMAKERTSSMHRTAALIDPLTGAWNRRGFASESDRLLRESRRDGSRAAVLFLDLDHFKSINDRYGHALGDEVLRLVTATLKSSVRSTDHIARLGGEEFSTILYGAPRDKAVEIAERIRSTFEERAAIVGGEPIAATVSIGVVHHEGPTIDLTELLAQADKALYQAKERGRNCVEVIGHEDAGEGGDVAPETAVVAIRGAT